MMMTRRQFPATAPIDGRTLPAAAPGSAKLWRALLAKSIKRTIVWNRSTRRMRRAIEELVALDDRMLADIGLSRGDVQYAEWHGRLPRAKNDGFRR
jgi:uncharacterized protein YjiS (DUF1127 family)